MKLVMACEFWKERSLEARSYYECAVFVKKKKKKMIYSNFMLHLILKDWKSELRCFQRTADRCSGPSLVWFVWGSFQDGGIQMLTCNSEQFLKLEIHTMTSLL